MNIKPILFSTDMVRAIMDGRKTETRRILKMTKEEVDDAYWGFTCFTPSGHISVRGAHANGQFGESFIKLKYDIGDVLWVRESAKITGITGTTRFYDSSKEPPPGYTSIKKIKIKYVADEKTSEVAYPDRLSTNIKLSQGLSNGVFKEAARIWLKVTGITVERLQDITEDSAKAEGLACVTKDGDLYKYGIPDVDGQPGGYNNNSGWAWSDWSKIPTRAFQTLWESINGEDSWVQNPWVWVVKFEVLSTTGIPVDIDHYEKHIIA